jgi:opacity protein-like surface antigen
MRRARLLRWSAASACVLALSAVAAQASDRGDRGDRDRSPRPDRMLVATTSQNQLLTFNARNPERIRDIQAISGLPAGVSLRGIDFRPKTGDLYGVGSDSVVYRVNPDTGIAIAEGPAFTPALRGRAYGVDINPVVDKIRVVSDDRQNLRLNVDEGTVLSADADLNPGMPQIVAAGYENSSFSFTQPTATTLHVVDAASDMLFTQNPPNNGTLVNGRRLRGVDVGLNAGFDIAGDDNLGYLANATSRRGTELYTVDVPTGRTKSLGRIGGGRRLVVTGLAAWQD